VLATLRAITPRQAPGEADEVADAAGTDGEGCPAQLLKTYPAIESRVVDCNKKELYSLMCCEELRHKRDR
jgi:hypothetical protein